MADGNRIGYYGAVLHHSTGPDFYNADDQTVRNWFNSVGKDRGYQGGALRSYHTDPGTGQETFAMAQFAGFPYDRDGNKYGYRIIALMNDPWGQVAWQCGNWDLNCKTVGIENCGNYLGKLLTDKQLMCIADHFRPHDRSDVLYYLHNEIFSTACPARISEQRDKLVDMINNPKKWNDLLFPAPAPTPPPPTPTPTPTPAPTPVAIGYTKFDNPVNLVTNKVASLWDLSSSGGWNLTKVKDLPVGEPFVAVASAKHPNGGTYYMTAYSYNGGNIRTPYGVNKADLNLPVRIPDPTPTPTPVPTPTPEDTQNSRISALEAIINKLRPLLAKIGINI